MFKSQIKPFKHDQNWDDIKYQYNSQSLFEDPHFPAADKSMFVTKCAPRGVKWKRPHVN